MIDSLPSQFKTALSNSNTSEFANLLAAQTRLCNTAYDRVNAAKEFSGDGGEEWDWKGRVGLEEEDEDEEEAGADETDAMQVDESSNVKKSEGTGPRAWTEEETAAYLRTGKKPVV